MDLEKHCKEYEEKITTKFRKAEKQTEEKFVSVIE